MKNHHLFLWLVLTFFLVGCNQDDSAVEDAPSPLSVSVRAGK